MKKVFDKMVMESISLDQNEMKQNLAEEDLRS